MVMDYRFTVKLNIYLVGYEPTMSIPVLWAYRRLDAHMWAYRLMGAHCPNIRYKLSYLIKTNPDLHKSSFSKGVHYQ